MKLRINTLPATFTIWTAGTVGIALLDSAPYLVTVVMAALGAAAVRGRAR